MTKKQIKDRCLERYNQQLDKYKKEISIMQFGQCLGFIDSLFYSEVLTSIECEKLSQQLLEVKEV